MGAVLALVRWITRSLGLYVMCAAVAIESVVMLILSNGLHLCHLAV